MATIDYKQKIKDYMNSSEVDTLYKSMLINLFPELKESEDESIRKDIIQHFAKGIEGSSFDEVREKYKIWLAWLEKQGEQKTTDKVQPKFNVGDVITPKDRGHEPWEIMQVDALNKKYRFKDGYVISFSQEDDYELVEQNPAEWSEEDENRINRLIAYFEDKVSFTAEDDIVYANWLKSLKDRVQPKQEWSEDDERHKRQILRILKDNRCSQTLQEKTEKWIEERLKSLRPQSRWKPSDEQMKALAGALSLAKNCGEESAFDLRTLYDDLKRLLKI